MSLQSKKIELIKKILETEDKGIIEQIESFLDTHPDGWFEDLPDEIRKSVETGLRESSKNQGIPHETVRRDLSIQVPDSNEWHEEVKADVEQSLAELDRGEGIPHENVMSEFARWRKK